MIKYINQISEPTALPVTVNEMKTFLRIKHDEEDLLLAGLIGAARDIIEEYVGISTCPQTWEVGLILSGENRLPRPPIVDVISFVVDGVEVDPSKYVLSTKMLVINDSALINKFGVIKYIAGTDTFKEWVRTATLLIVTNMYENRQGEAMKNVVEVAANILNPHREMWL